MAWLEKIDIHAVLKKYREGLDQKSVVKALKKEVKKSIWLSDFAKELPDNADEDKVNGWLNRVYDAADLHRVWVGMPYVT